jgi:hypothetical protein
MNIRRIPPARALVLAALLPVAACSVDVQDREAGKAGNVDIRTPLGDVSVRTDIDAATTGLRVYPGARPVRHRNDHPESADVNVGNSLFGVKVVAATFESDAEPDAVLGFYRNELKAYGDVIECHGDIDFKGRRGEERPVCREKWRSRDVQLVAGTEHRHRIVSVKPRGEGSEFAMVYIQTRGAS